MSGLIDFRKVSPVPDVPLEEETGMEDDDGFYTNELVAMGISNSDSIEKDS